MSGANSSRHEHCDPDRPRDPREAHIELGELALDREVGDLSSMVLAVGSLVHPLEQLAEAIVGLLRCL